MNDNNGRKELIRNGFEKVLNRHGYGFHYAVLNLAADLYAKKKSKWMFEVAEFPVEVQGKSTRIDFILRLKSEIPILMIAECKRANPSLSNWCFTKAPFVRRNRRSNEPLFIEHVRLIDNNTVNSTAKQGLHLDNAYHIALEVKSREKGDASGGYRGVIEEAATQICRGVNGMVEFYSKNKEYTNWGIYLLPVIFTTAEIWVSDVNLKTAKLHDGKVDLSSTSFEKKSWIFYQYHISPGIKHSQSHLRIHGGLSDILATEYIRSIAIVAPSGIEEFLTLYTEPDDFLSL